MIESMNIIDALSNQILALLDLMMMAGKDVDIESMNTAAEMCMTMHDEMKNEVDKMFKLWQQEQKEADDGK